MRVLIILFHYVLVICLSSLFLFVIVFCVCQWSNKTRLVALIILAPVSSETDLATWSYEGLFVEAI